MKKPMLNEDDLKRLNEGYHALCTQHGSEFCKGCPYNHFFCKVQYFYEKGYEKAEEDLKKECGKDWIKTVWKVATPEDIKDLGYEEYVPYVPLFEIPEDGQLVLISMYGGKRYEVVEFIHDAEGCSDYEGNDWFNDVDAWMPIQMFKKEGIKCG